MGEWTKEGLTMYYIGILGMIFIIAGWVMAFKDIPPLRLSILYSLGSFLLAVYAFTLKDTIFLTLNLLATLFSAMNAIRALRCKRT